MQEQFLNVRRTARRAKGIDAASSLNSEDVGEAENSIFDPAAAMLETAASVVTAAAKESASNAAAYAVIVGGGV